VAVFVVRRLVVSFFILLLSSFIMYVLVAHAGNPLETLLTDTSPGREARIAARVEQLNLDVSVPQRYLLWLGDTAQCVIPGRCDLGENVRGQDVTVLLSQAISSTLRLVLFATLLAVVLGTSIGIISALRQYSGFDYTITFSAFLFFSLPVFWVAVLLKQYLAIGVNDWYADPGISVAVALVLAVLSGLAWGAIIGGDARRRWVVRAVAAGATLLVLLYLSAVDWFSRPALGPVLITVFSLGGAVGLTALLAGLRRRPVLYAALATAAVGCASQFFVIPLLQSARWASWTNLLLAALVAVAVAVAVGYALGGLDRSTAIRVSVLTALFTGLLLVVDIVLRTIPGYARSVNGRILATTGAQTPNYEGTFWQTNVDLLTHLLLPTLAIMLISFASYSRYSRSSMLETLNQDYVRTARAKGLTERTVVMRHAFRNALIPLTTLAAVDFGAVIGGAVITERVFGWQGMGALFINGLLQTDPNPVMGFFILTAVAVVVFNLVADIAYAYLDPRIRLS
jgi:peptide/nickel transport system permease protein